MTEPLHLEHTRFHLQESRRFRWGVPAALAAVAVFALLLRTGNDIAGGAAGVWAMFVIFGAIAWFRTRHRVGEGVTIYTNMARFGDRVLSRSEIDLMFTTPPGRTESAKLWIMARRGHAVGWFDVDDATAARAQQQLMLGGARFRALKNDEAPLQWWLNNFVFVAAFVGLSAILAWWMPSIALALVAWIRHDQAHCQIEASLDGLTVRSWRTESVAWDEVVAIETLPYGFFVRRKTGGALSFLHLGDRVSESETYDRTAMLTFVDRLKALKDESEGRECKEVAARVAAALAAEGPFREASIRREDLWVVVESGSVLPAVRARAAKMLAAESTPVERERFRIAAEWCIEPEVRVELEKAGDDSGSVEGLDEREIHARR